MATNPDGSIPIYENGSIPIGGLALPVVGSIYDSTMRSRDVKKQIEAQKREAELAYQRQVEMWHLQNAYNSPSEQMKRFGAAGLNPHLIYGQGSSGLSSGTPQYQPPNIQMQGASPAYGSAIGSLLPTMMAVGTWMQNMRMSEVDIKQKETSTDKMQQVIEFMSQRNPRELGIMDNKLDLFPHQKSMQEALSQSAWTKWNDLLQEYRYKWTGPTGDNLKGAKGQELMKLMAERRLKEHQADWFEPATIMRMVLGMLGGMTRVVPRGGGSAVKQIGKGQRGRWSTQKKRWLPSR